MKQIEGGYILLSRKIIESEVFKKPPLYLKVWIYLLTRAQYSDYKELKRGQLYTDIDQIREACSYYVGYRKETPSRNEIYKILNWMKNQNMGENEALRNHDESNNESNSEGTAKASMIATTKATHGMVITIGNYGVYQDNACYESNNEGNDEKETKATTKELRKTIGADNINKTNKIKNNKDKIKKDIYTDLAVSEEVQKLFNHWNEQKIVVHRELTGEIVKAIEKALRQYGGNRCGEAIDLYSDAYYDQKFYYSHKWTLLKFLKQSNGIIDWMEDGQRYIEYNDYLDQPVSD